MTNYILKTEILQFITSEQAWHYKIIPVSEENGVVTFISDTISTSKQEEIEIVLGRIVHIIQEDSELIDSLLSKHYRKNNSNTTIKINSGIVSEHFVFEILSEANNLDSSDIHFEIFNDFCRIRMRIDGKLIERYILQKAQYPAIINKIKIQANLDIAEKRLPQDGRIIYNFNDIKFDVRVSVLPTLYGEKVVLRLLSKDATMINLEQLGFSEKQLTDYLEGLKKTTGIILISGPTGSGKTTTLYGTLKELNSIDTNIVTIEDPIEYTLDGINQVQLNEAIGLGFVSALKSFLRQDPDIIMLGEIRDVDTANMAIRASLTGHLVLSTIHTNSAWGTISRLVDMGVQPFLIANTLNLSVAQRLVRLLCPHCKKPIPFKRELFPPKYILPETCETVYEPVGCDVCFHTGFKGRKAVFEVIPIDEDMVELVKNNELNIKETLKNKQISTLSAQAFQMIKRGHTSVNEVYPILLNEF